MSFLAELWQFMRVRKKYWLLPIMLMMALFGGLIVLTQGSRRRAVHLHAVLSERPNAHPRHLGVLSRQRGRAGRGRRDRRRRAGGALHAQEARRRLSRATRSRTAWREAGIELDRGRLRRVLRQAVPEVRAAARDLSRVRAQGLRLVPHGDAGVAEGEAVPEAAAARSSCANAAPARTIERQAPVHRASSEPRGERVLPVAVRGGGGPDDGRRRRVGDHVASASAAATSSRCCKEIHFPHSLGLLYSAFTYYTGFKVNSGEYKVMGLAPYGEPKYAELILDHLIDLKADGIVPARPWTTSTTAPA